MPKLRINPTTGQNEWVEDPADSVPGAAQGQMDFAQVIAQMLAQQTQQAQMRDAFNRDATFGRHLPMSQNSLTPQAEWASMFASGGRGNTPSMNNPGAGFSWETAYSPASTAPRPAPVAPAADINGFTNGVYDPAKDRIGTVIGNERWIQGVPKPVSRFPGAEAPKPAGPWTPAPGDFAFEGQNDSIVGKRPTYAELQKRKPSMGFRAPTRGFAFGAP